MALFGNKKKNDETDAGATEDAATVDKGTKDKKKKDDAVEYSPEKAVAFFNHARTAHESTNYEYAMQLWLQGLRWDPSSLNAIESFFASAAQFLGNKEKKSSSGETRKAIAAPGTVGRFTAALLEWGTRPRDSVSAVRATEACAKLGEAECTYWLGQRALNLARRDKRPRKDLFEKLLEAFKTVGAYDKAVEAGEDAMKIDPEDGKLQAYVRNMSAQATMSQGGYDKSGEAGGFRKNIKDIDKQRQLAEADQISKSEDAKDRLVIAAEKEWQERPGDTAAITTLGKRLLERGKPEDEERAYKLYIRAYKETDQFRFREWAGDIKLRRGRRILSRLEMAAKERADDPAAQEKFKKARIEFINTEVEEFEKRVAAYPTDLRQKYELGKRLFELERYEDAIPMFQQSQDDSRLRIESMSCIATAFERIGYLDEAIHTYRQAIAAHHDPNNEIGLDLRFGLLTSLQAKAMQDKDLTIAEEAERIASEIAIQQFNYRDIRDRRESLKKLVAELKGAA